MNVAQILFMAFPREWISDNIWFILSSHATQLASEQVQIYILGGNEWNKESKREKGKWKQRMTDGDRYKERKLRIESEEAKEGQKKKGEKKRSRKIETSTEK